MDLKKEKHFQQHKMRNPSFIYQKSGDIESSHRRQSQFSTKHHTKKEGYGRGDNQQSEITNSYLHQVKCRSVDPGKSRSHFNHSKGENTFALQPNVALFQNLESTDLKTEGFSDSKKAMKKKSDNRSFHTLSYQSVKKENLEMSVMSEAQLVNQENKTLISAANDPDPETPAGSLQNYDQQSLLLDIEKVSLSERNVTPEQIIIKDTVIDQQFEKYCCKICGKVFDNLKNSAKELMPIYTTTSVVFSRGKSKECFQCKLCQKSERLRNYIEKHILEHMAHNEVTCKECQSKHPEYFSFLSQVMPSSKVNEGVTKSLFSEKLVQELSKIPVYCRRCEIDFCHADALLRRLDYSEVTKKTPIGKETRHLYTCGLCNDTGDGKVKSIIHICDHIKSGEVYCKSCQPYIQSSSNQTATSFIQLWPDDDVHCGNCNRAVEQDEVLLIDVLSLNNNPETKAANLNIVYICQICQFKSYQKNRMSRHLRNHMEQNYILCEKCQGSKRKTDLVKDCH